MTSRNLLQQLHRLQVNGSSPGFQDRLCNILYGEGYEQSVPKLQNEDLVWLVDYLDKVCRHTALPHSPLKQA